jgi:hypothetical protein
MKSQAWCQILNKRHGGKAIEEEVFNVICAQLLWLICAVEEGKTAICAISRDTPHYAHSNKDGSQLFWGDLAQGLAVINQGDLDRRV